MTSLTCPTSYATAAVLGWPSTVPMSGHGDALPRTFINDPSTIDLVEAFTTNADSNALVLYMLQSLTYDAVATLQSLQPSNITQHLAAFEEVLRSYAISLGKTGCATHWDGGNESPSSRGSPMEIIPPTTETARHWTTKQRVIENPHERDNAPRAPGKGSFGLHVVEDGGCSSQSSGPITPQNILPHPQSPHGYPSSVRSSKMFVPSGQYLQSSTVSQQDSGIPGISVATFSQDSDTACQPISGFSIGSATTYVEPIDQDMFFPAVPLPALSVGSPNIFSSLDPHNRSNPGAFMITASINSVAESFIAIDIRAESRPTCPPWQSPPAPAFLPTPTFLNREAQDPSLSDIDSLPFEDTSFLCGEDDLNWKGLEKAISDARSQAASDRQHIDVVAQEPEPSDLDFTLDDIPSVSGLSTKTSLVSQSKNSISFKHESFRPFSISPLPLLEPSGLATAAYPANPAHSVNVPDSYLSNKYHGPGSDYACSDASGYWQSSSILHGVSSAPPELFEVSSNPEMGMLGQIVNASLSSPDNSFTSSQSSCSTAIFMDDDARRHILAPKPIRACARPSFLDDFPPPRLSPYLLNTIGDICNEVTPMLCEPTQSHILTLVEAVFEHAVSTDHVIPVIELLSYVFRFWRDKSLVASDWRLSTTASEWIEFTSQSLATRIRQEFRRVVKMSETSFPVKVAPILKFILYLQDLPSVARKALQSLRTLVDAVLDNHETTQRSACLVAQRMNFLVAYFNPSMKGKIGSSWATSWKTVRSAALSFIYGKLRSFVCLFIESSAREMHDVDRVMYLANFLWRLRPKNMLNKVLPIKKLVALLKPPDRPTHGTRLHYVKAAATLLLTVCSKNLDSGCIVCSKHNVEKPARQQGRACACTAYLDLMDYDLDTARSLIRRGRLKDGFMALLEMDFIEAHVNKSPRGQ